MSGRLHPICEKFRTLRRDLGLSLSQVEEKTGGAWKAVVVGSYERGDRQPSIARADALLRLYGQRLAIVPADTPDRLRKPPSLLNPAYAVDVAERDGRLHLLCRACGQHVAEVEAGRSLEGILAEARSHHAVYHAGDGDGEH